MPETQQKAILLLKPGQLAVERVPIPKPGPDEVLIKLDAAALNPADWKISKLGLFVKEYPSFLGLDGAGVVVEVGQGVKDIVKGDRVTKQVTSLTETATFQEYTLAPASIIYKVPDNITLDEAATLPVGLPTAFVGLYNDKPHGAGLTSPFTSAGQSKYSGKPLVVLGGSGSVGQYVIQLAKLSGFSPIITTASSKHKAYLESLGATHVIGRDSIGPAIAKITSAPIEFVYDAVSSPETQQAGYDLLAPGGQIVIIQQPAIETTVPDKGINGVVATLSLPFNAKIALEYNAHVIRFLAEGLIKPNRVEIVPGGLGAIPAALDRLERGEVSGVKLVVHPQETA